MNYSGLASFTYELMRRYTLTDISISNSFINKALEEE